MSREILSDGKTLPFPLEIARPWPLIPGRGKLARADLVTLHWSVTKSARQTYEVLNQRGLGCHLLVDSDGSVIQVGDLDQVQWTTKGVNQRSVGIEITTPYELSAQDPAHLRPVWELGVRGDKTKHLGFYPEQVLVLLDLVKALCDMLSLPRVIPGRAGHAFNDTLAPERLASFRGVLGHYHVSHDKIDAGTAIWDAFLAAGFGVEEV